MKKFLINTAIILSLAVVCFATFWEVLGYYFTSMDAFPLLSIAKIDSMKDISKLLTSPLGGGFPFGTYYRPLSELSYAIDYRVWGNNPKGYHLTNILLHYANSIIAFVSAFILWDGNKKGILYAWITAVLFIICPLSAAVVPSLARRQDMLSAFFIGLSILFFGKMLFTKNNKKMWYVLSLFTGFLAVFSKESAYVIPVLIFLLSFIFDDTENPTKRLKIAVKYSVPFFVFALFNTILHIYFFGYWGVHGPSGIYQHFKAALMSFYIFMGPLEILKLSMNIKMAFMLFMFVFIIIYISKIIFKHGLRGSIELLLYNERKGYTYLISIILTYVMLFIVSGKSLDYYHYFPYMAFTIIFVRIFFDTFINKKIFIIAKLVSVIFILYTIIYSPLITKYSAWQMSSEITRQTIKETETALLADREASRIYLINWPGFIGRESEMPMLATNSTILLSYSMDAWADWSGIRDSRDVKLEHVSITSFPAGNIKAKINYSLSDKKIDMIASGCKISGSKIPQKTKYPFEIRIDNENKMGELVFSRELNGNERLYLYDIKGIKIINRVSQDL